MTRSEPNAMPTLANLKPGAHLCSLYQTEEEHRALLTPFLRQGLERGEKVLYIVDARTADAILNYLRKDGLDVKPFLARKQLQILTVQEAYLREGSFDPERMIGLLRSATDLAVTEGYPALRVTGEMTWALRGLPGSERLIEYEAKLNNFFPGSRCLALCQYDRRRFAPEVQLDILATHPFVAVGTEIHHNPYYLPPDAFLAKDRPEARLEQWLNHLAAQRRMEAELHRVLHDRGERVKELTALYRGTRLLQDETRPILDCLREVVALLPPAYQYPEVTAARLAFDGVEARTPGFRETPWKQSAAFAASDGKQGMVEVVYLEPRPPEAEGPFLAEERSLLNMVADSVSSFLERRDSQVTMDRTTRALRMVSLCNRVLIRATNEDEFLKDICRILVEAGAYAMAWIGLAEQDAGKTVRPVAYAGAEAGYLESIKVSWADNERGRGPTGTALRTGQPCIVRNILTDPNFAPWQTDASARGYQSVIAIPLFIGDRPFASMQIFASEPDAFGAEEVRLLAELADDAAYGVEQLRMRAERQQLSEQLLSQARTLDAFFNYSVTPLVILDTGFNFVRVNEAYAKSGGRRPADFIGRNHFEMYPSDARGIFEEVVRTKRPYQAIGRPFVYSDHPEWGVTYWDWILTPILDSTGEVEFLVFSLNDVTERKRAEEAIRQSEERYRSLVVASARIVWTTDPGGSVVQDIPSWRAFTGQREEEVKGSGWISAVHEEDHRRTMDTWRQAVETRNLYETEYRIRRKDGEFRLMAVRGVPVLEANGQVREWVGICTDITEHRRAEEQVRLVTRALEAAANGVVITDAKGTILWVNPAFTRLTGYAVEEALGHNPRLLKSGKQDQQFYERLWATITGGQVWRGEVMNKRKDGSFYPEEMTITPVRGLNGEITNFVAIKQDITERKQMQHHAQRIEQLAAMGQLLGGIVHELKNPLFVVSGRVQLLKEKIANREYDQLGSDLHRIEEAAQRMGSIAQRFLTLARPIQPSLQACSIPAVVKGVLDFLANELMKHRITVSTDFGADLPGCITDPAQLHQAVLNLVMNAMQAMAQAHGQGRLSISAGLAAEGEKDWIELRIRDDGPGIPPEHRDMIFEPFFTTKPLGEGTGLGLWTVQMIVESLSGRVTYETELDRGTAFIIRLPAAPAPPAATRAEQKQG